MIDKLKPRDRIFLEQQEKLILAPYAVLSVDAHKTRRLQEPEHPYRTAIQRDRDRIIHSRAFRRLKHKRQVFLVSFGDHYRTRLTHTLEVSQISRTIAKALGLNEELTEAVALGHDLGHTPFGHAGEVVLNRILSGQDNLDGILTGENIGGFKHNYQSLRVVDQIEKEYFFDGLNLTAYVREGIIKHTRLKRASIQYPELELTGIYFELDNATHLEGQVVAISDEIAQRTHDLEDGIIAGLVNINRVLELPVIQYVKERITISTKLEKQSTAYRNSLINGLISVLIGDIIETSMKKIQAFYEKNNRLNYFDEEIVSFSEEINPLQIELDAFIHREIIRPSSSSQIIAADEDTIRNLFKSFYQKPPAQIAGTLTMGYESYVRSIADYIAGMTDHYAQTEIKKQMI
ncbi:dNTP triphosphohydrolase [candidate division KSB1 bacterium]|nr:dNTP triphosphohydrolase [candidate division KSB1 bacterium]